MLECVPAVLQVSASARLAVVESIPSAISGSFEMASFTASNGQWMLDLFGKGLDITTDQAVECALQRNTTAHRPRGVWVSPAAQAAQGRSLSSEFENRKHQSLSI